MKLKSASEQHTLVTWGAVLLVFAAAPAFWWVQNTLQPVGGAMALQKALWLADAIVLWMVLPLAIVCDARVSTDVRRAFRALLILMLARAVVEGWMLYVTFNWSPWYGIVHDLACVAVLVWHFARLHATAGALWLTHIAATAAPFAPEIYFAWYMQKHFHNQGTDAVYFVPDDPAHAFALNVTTAAVVCCTAYIFIFLARWLHAASDRGGAQAR